MTSPSDNPGQDNMVFESQGQIGPVRKKSILVKSSKYQEYDPSKSDNRKISNTIEYKTDKTESSSWWFTCCNNYRKKHADQPWEPGLWQLICPYPYCPTYRQFARLIAFTLIGGLAYFVIYAVVGQTAAPGGKLFSLVFLTFSAYLAGYLISLTGLPALIGMLFVGLIYQNVGLVDIDESYSEITKYLRHAALVIILIRAGLDLDPDAMKRLSLTVLKLSLGPWLLEVVVVAVMVHFFIDFPWWWAFLLGTAIAAVAPAVVVSCIFRLRTKGYGVAKGIPTLILAASSICDATSVAIFGIVKSMMFSDDSMATQLLIGPVSIFGGIGFGLLWGVMSKFVPEERDPFMVPLRILLLLVGGLVAVFGSEFIGYGGAGPLGCVTAAFVSILFWTKQGWNIEDNPAGTAFEIFWEMFEPILFGVTGTQLKINELREDVVVISVGILILAIFIRILGTIVMGLGSGLNVKEKLFVALSLIPKATVQAALGPVALAIVAENTLEHTYARRILMIALLSILIATPLGALSISFTGKWLLTKTKFPDISRKSHRPSIRDLSIVPEDTDDTEKDVENQNTTEESSEI